VAAIHQQCRLCGGISESCWHQAGQRRQWLTGQLISARKENMTSASAINVFYVMKAYPANQYSPKAKSAGSVALWPSVAVVAAQRISSRQPADVSKS